jgi:phage FluMu protein Com
MQLRCYQCGWSFAIGNEVIAAAVESLEASGGAHYDARCPRCKRANNVSMEQLKRALPRPPRPEAGKPPA